MSREETRSEALGVNVPKLKRATATRIRKGRALMVELAGLWGDIDEAMVGAADDMMRRFDELTDTLDASVELLREEWPS